MRREEEPGALGAVPAHRPLSNVHVIVLTREWRGRLLCPPAGINTRTPSASSSAQTRREGRAENRRDKSSGGTRATGSAEGGLHHAPKHNLTGRWRAPGTRAGGNTGEMKTPTPEARQDSLRADFYQEEKDRAFHWLVIVSCSLLLNCDIFIFKYCGEPLVLYPHSCFYVTNLLHRTFK